MKHVKNIILVVTALLGGIDCYSGISTIQDVTPTSANLVMKGPPDCSASGYMHFEYADSKTAVAAGKGQSTPEVHCKKNIYSSEGKLAKLDRSITGLSPDTTYFYRQCWRDADTPNNTCTPASQFTTRDSAGSMQRITALRGDLFRDGKRFRVLGVQNLDHDFEHDFYTNGSNESRTEMADRIQAARTMGANTMRIHLQLFDFIERNAEGELFIRQGPFDNLAFLRTIAEQEGLYLLVSGNNVWFPDEVPVWYDEMLYRDRWDVQAFFFKQLAKKGADSPAILAYELMSEPTIRVDDNADWYSGELAGYWFVQSIARGVPRSQFNQVARNWITRLTTAIRKHDPDRLITFGAMGKFQNGALGIDNTAPLLDIVSPHIYPKIEDPEYAIRTAKRFAMSGKPVVIGETHLYRSNSEMYRDFLTTSAPVVDGYISFFNGRGPDDMLIDQEDPKANVLEVHKVNLQVLQNLRKVILDPQSEYPVQ
jgi:hypothetical protein